MPPPNRRRAVFTGLGVLTSLGHDPATYFASLLAGTPGVRRLTHFDPTGLPCQLGGEVRDYDGKKFLPAANRDARKGLNKMARTVQFGYTTAVKAWEDANGPKPGEIDPFRFGVEFGCVMVATELDDLVGGGKVAGIGPGEVDMRVWGEAGLDLVPPQWMLKYLPNMPACHASIYVDAQGPNNTVTAGDVASALALGEALRVIQRGAADAFLVGGCDSKLNPVSFARHTTFQELTRENEAEGAAVKPFGRDRSGVVLGEGAAVFMLEELESATKRGARIDAEVVGFASGIDPTFSGEILATVIRRAMADASVTPTDIDHVNAAAGGSVKLDRWEAVAIHQVFGPDIPVFSARGHIGGTGAASGLLELAASVLALKAGTLPATLNSGDTGPDCPVSVVTMPRPVTKPCVLKISYTDMGQCAAVIVRRGE